MKKSFLNILIFFIAVLFLSCEREVENNSASVFTLTPPSFNNPNGAKTYWTDDGLWWDSLGSDYICVNNYVNLIQIKRVGNEWKAITSGDPVLSAADGDFYVCYVGGDDATRPDFDYVAKTFKNVNLSSGIIPLVGHSGKPYITLKPCCAVLRFINVPDGYSVQAIFPDDNVFPKKGDISVIDECIVESTGPEYFTNVELTASPSNNGVATIVLPMKGQSYTSNNSVTFKATKSRSPSIDKQTRESITIQRGCVYVIDFES